MNPIKLLASFAVFATLTITSVARADVNHSSITAATCVPDQSSAGLYEEFAGTIRFKSTATGTLTLFCAIPFKEMISNSNQRLKMTYTDSSANGSSGSVIAILAYMDHSTANVAGISTISSEPFNWNATTQRFVNFSYTSTSILTRSYYVKVTLFRLTNAQNVQFSNITLSSG